MTPVELRAIDAEVAVKVFGWDGDIRECAKGLDPETCPHADALLPYYSTDIAAAWLVMEWLHERDCDVSLEGAGDFWSVRFLAGEVTTLEPTAPLAICKAALAAVEGALRTPPAPAPSCE